MAHIEHSESFTVRSYEVDGSGFVPISQIANYFQEAAGKNAHDLNFDISHLQEKGATWVLFRLHIKIDQFPVRWQHVTVKTWPSSGDGIRAFRDYELVDESDKRLGIGVSQWMVLNMKNRRPMRMPKEVLEMGLEVEEHVLPVDKDPLPQLDSRDVVTEITVGDHDLDMNRHVNNVKYIEWMTGFCTGAIGENLKCKEIKIQFHREASVGDKVVIVTQKGSSINQLIHQVKHQPSEKLLAEGVSWWR